MVLISIILLILHTFMQNKSVDLHNNNSGLSNGHIYCLSSSRLEQMPVSILFTTLSAIIEQSSTEAKNVLIKLHTPSLFENLKNSLDTLQTNNSKFRLKDKESYLSQLPTVYNEEKWVDPKLSIKETLNDDLSESLIFVSDGLQFLNHVTFDQKFHQNPKKIFKILAQDIHDDSRYLMKEVCQQYPTLLSNSDALQGALTKEQFFQKLKSYLRKSLLVSLKDSLENKETLQKKIQNDTKNKKEINSFWKCLQKQNKLKILLLNCKDVEGLSYHLGKEKIYISTKKLEHQIEKLLSCDLDFVGTIFRCPLGEILNPFVQYLKLLFAFLKKQTENSKRKRTTKQSREDRDYNSQQKLEQKQRICQKKQRKKKGKKGKSLSLESNQTNYTQHERHFLEKYFQKGQKQEECEVKPELRDNFQKLENRSYKRQLSSCQQEEISSRSSKIYWNQETKQQISKTEQMKNPELSTEIDHNTKDSVSSKKTFSSEKGYRYPPPLPTTFQSQFIREATIKKLDLQLSELSDQISEEANEYFQRRIVAFQRIQFLLNYYSVPIKLFGSCANGIAVKNSDIDIAIDQNILQMMNFLPEHERVPAGLEWLEELFSCYPCFMDIKVIKTAAIPVIKLTIDTSSTFISSEYSSLNRPHNSGKIKADITIQTQTNENQSCHLGIRTTSAITEWLSEIKSLHTIIIIMKNFFALSNLNLAYQGGLNTISMIVMFVAYIKHQKMEEEQNYALVLQKILDFYSNEFDEKKYGIDILDLNGEHIYYTKANYNLDNSSLMKADLQIRDPISQSKNMTRNSYLYPQIKNLFKKMLEECYHKSEHQLQQALQQMNLSRQEIMEFNSEIFQHRNVFLQLQKEMNTQHF